jgi:hypothetical protein
MMSPDQWTSAAVLIARAVKVKDPGSWPATVCEARPGTTPYRFGMSPAVESP